MNNIATKSNIKRICKHCNISRVLILSLIIWNIVLTCQFIPHNQIQMPTFTDEQNQEIMQLEEISTKI